MKKPKVTSNNFFPIHTHAIPDIWNTINIESAVIVAEMDSRLLKSYYGIHTPSLSINQFLNIWPKLKKKLKVKNPILALEGLPAEKLNEINLNAFFNVGGRVIQPCHWRDTFFAKNGKITIEGRGLLKLMLDFDIILDVSHMTERVFYQSIDAFDGRIIASHVVLDGLLSNDVIHSNSLTTSMFLVLKSRSALVGVPFINDLLSFKGLNTSKMVYDANISHLIEQVFEISSIVGSELVSFGPDYFDFSEYSKRMNIPVGFADGLNNECLLEELSEKLLNIGFSKIEIENLFYQNANEFFKNDIKNSQKNISENVTREKQNYSWSFLEPKDIGKANQENFDLPSHAWISLSNFCNLKCFHCRRTYTSIGNKLRSKDISNDLYNSIVSDVVPSLNSLILGGNNLSEVTHAKRFPAFVNYLSEMNKKPEKISLQTNGSIFNVEILEQLIHLNTVFNISVEGGTEETTKRIRHYPLSKLGQWIKVINSMRLLKESNSRVVLSFTAMNSTIAELPDLLEFAECNGVDEVNVMYLLPPTNNFNNESPYYESDRVNEIIRDSFKLVESWHVYLLAPEIQMVNENQDCIKPWYSVSINAEGDVRFCCLEDSPIIGNLNENSYKSIWNGSRAKELRANINTKNTCGSCNYCVLRNLPVVSSEALKSYLK